MNKPIGELIRVRASFRLTIAIVLFGSAAILSTAYWFRPDWREELKFFGAALGVAGGLQSAYYAQRALQANINDKRLSAACDYFHAFYGPDYKDLRERWRAISEEIHGKAAAEVTTILLANTEKRNTVGELLNFFEGLGYAARRERIEVRTIADLMKTVIGRTHGRLAPWLDHHRRQEQQPTAWEHFEWLHQEIEKLKR